MRPSVVGAIDFINIKITDQNCAIEFKKAENLRKCEILYYTFL